MAPSPTAMPSLTTRSSTARLGPFRSAGRSLRERRSALEAELAHTSAALADIERRLADEAQEFVDQLAVTRPCPMRWDELRGSGAVRQCDRCDREVYDVAAMTAAEVERLVAASSTMPCMRLLRRPDGRVVTADCPRNRAPRVVLVAAVAATVVGPLLVAAGRALRPSLGGVRRPLKWDTTEAESLESGERAHEDRARTVAEVPAWERPRRAPSGDQDSRARAQTPSDKGVVRQRSPR